MNTVGEAIALGTLLRWVLQTPSAYGLPIPSSGEAKDAAVLLAEKARKTGACSVGPEEVETLWDKAFPVNQAETEVEKDLAACALFLRRGAQRWRIPANDYSPTASGLLDALKDELQAGIPRPGAGDTFEAMQKETKARIRKGARLTDYRFKE